MGFYNILWDFIEFVWALIMDYIVLLAFCGGDCTCHGIFQYLLVENGIPIMDDNPQYIG